MGINIMKSEHIIRMHLDFQIILRYHHSKRHLWPQIKLTISNHANSLTCHIEVVAKYDKEKLWKKWGTSTTKNYWVQNLKYGNTHYEIRAYYKSKSGFSNYSVVSSFQTSPVAPTNNYWVKNLKNGNKYYEVRAYYKNASGFSNYSAISSFQTLPVAPVFSVFSVQNITTQSATLKFTNQSSLKCYVEIKDVNESWKRLPQFTTQNTFVCKNLKSNHNYQVRTFRTNESKSSNYSKIISFTTLPQAPIFSISNISSSSAKLTISNHVNNLTCHIEVVGKNDKEKSWKKWGTATTNNYWVKNLKNGNKYYEVRAYYKNASGFSNYSAISSFQTLPVAPVFSVQNITTQSATLKFTNQSSLKCYVEIKDVNKSWEKLSQFTTQNTFVCKNLKSNHKYQVRTFYTNESKSSNYSKTTSFTTSPQAPIFSISNINSSSAKLTISNYTNNLTCHIEVVGKNEKEKSWKKWGTSTTNNYWVKNLKNGNKYYEVRAYYKNASGFSNYSAISSFQTTPVAPDFSVQNITTHSVTLKFTNQVSLKCYVEIADVNQSNWKQLSEYTTQNSFLCKNLKTNHAYQVKAFYTNKSGSSYYSTVKQFATI
eukprot:88815_1